MDKRDFDQLLKDRHVPDASSNLSSRIIEASRTLPQESKQPLFAGVREFMQGFARSFAVPQPALVMGMILILSVGATAGVGFYGGRLLSEEPEAVSYYSEADDVELAFYLDDIFEIDY